MLRKLLGYAAVMFGASAFTSLLNFAVNTLGMVTRSKSAYGDYATYILIYSVTQGLFILGINQCIQKDAADDETERRRFAALAYRVFAALLLVCGAAAAFTGYFFAHHLALSFVGVPFVVLWWWGRYIARSALNAKREASMLMLASSATTLFQFLLLTFTPLEHALIYGDCLSLITAGVVTFFTLPGTQGVGLWALITTPIPRDFLARNWEFLKPNWWAGQIFAAGQSLTSAWTRTALGAQPMAALGATFQMWLFASKPIEYLTAATLPGLVSAKERRPELYRQLLRLCLLAFPMIGATVTSGISLLLVILGMGEKYAEVPSLMVVLALSLPIVVFQMVTNQLVVAEGRPKLSLYAHVVQIGINIAVVLPLTAYFGLFGALVASSLATAGNALALAVTMRKESGPEIRAGIRWTILSIIATSASLLPYLVARHHPLAWTSGFLVPPIYLAAALILRLAGRADVIRFLELVKLRRPVAVPAADKIS